MPGSPLLCLPTDGVTVVPCAASQGGSCWHGDVGPGEVTDTPRASWKRGRCMLKQKDFISPSCSVMWSFSL